MSKIKEILLGDNNQLKRALLSFDLEKDSEEEILTKFNLWVRYLFPKQFKKKDAPFHVDIDRGNLRAWKGEIDAFYNSAYRGSAKTTRTKMFAAFVICCDMSLKDNTSTYMKILCKDLGNAKQLVTDIYNILVNSRVTEVFGDMFNKTKEKKKRQETMGVFTTRNGVKLKAGTVGVDQRGDNQGDEETARPRWVWFDDFETRKTLRSAVETKALWENMEEARTGLSVNGACIYTFNYISERGNCQRLIARHTNASEYGFFIDIGITEDKTVKGEPTWKEMYTTKDIEKLHATDDDFWGERMNKPSAGMDIVFNRERLDNMEERTPTEISIGFKRFYDFNPSHRYGQGADVAGGVGLDSSADVIIDFSTVPARVVGTFASNTIKPDDYGHELKRHLDFFGKPISAPENNKFDMCIGVLKGLYDNMYTTEDKASKMSDRRKKTYGWNTNRLTKPKMIFELKKAVEDGLLELSDPALILELKSYTRDDLMDAEIDPRLTTRHFDLLIACAIAWQMKDFAQEQKPYTSGVVSSIVRPRNTVKSGIISRI